MSSRRFPEFVRFLGVGAVNTLIGLLTIYAAMGLFDFGDVAANFVGYSVGLFIRFALNSRWTFAYQGAQLPAPLKFIMVNLIAYSMNLVTVPIAIRHFELNVYVA